MRRYSPLLTAAVALAALWAAPPALAAQSPTTQAPAAQSGTPAARADSAHRLPTVDVKADKEQGGALARVWRTLGYRAEVTALMRENRELARQLHRYDQQIARLEAYRDSLVASRELREHRIAMLDSATAATRAERLRLEAQVRLLEGRGANAVATP
jgi:hypothetical protein